METEDYVPIVEAGAEGLVVYQETYNRAIYDQLHLAGPKKDFAWRLVCPERVYDAGWRERVEQLYGSKPSIAWFDSPVVVDNATDGSITRAA